MNFFFYFCRVRELTCGFSSSEPMVCCPQTNSIDNIVIEEECGQPMLYNWWKEQNKNIGSQPWVVRVGFRSNNKFISKCAFKIKYIKSLCM